MKKTSPKGPKKLNHSLRCKICGKLANHDIYQVKEMMFGTREVFDYFQCNNCECLQIVNIPTNLEIYYPPSYYSFTIDKISKKGNFIHNFLTKQRAKYALFGKGYKLNKLLKSFIDMPKEIYRTGRIIKKAKITDFDASFLDVGCGAQSRWLTDLSKIGFSNLLGVDPYIAKDNDDKRILKQKISEVTGLFSLITFHHSFEHIPDQHCTLQHVAKRLKPNGVCLIRIPTVSSYAWEKYKTNWVELDAPRHLFLHSKKSIELLGEKAGLELYDIVYDSIELEFFGSEQYCHDIPLMDKQSYLVNPENSIFSPQEISEFKSLSKKVNSEGTAGRAGFYFKLKKN